MCVSGVFPSSPSEDVALGLNYGSLWGEKNVVYASFLYLTNLIRFMIGKTCGAGGHCDANFKLEFEVVFVVIRSR